MSLYTKKGHEVPKDAVRLDEDGAIKFMQTILASWSDASDTFYIRYGPGILSGITTLSSLYLNNYYRSRLRLLSHGRMSAYLPIIVIPSLINYFGHTISIQQPIMIEKFTCPVCMELRASGFQVLTGVVYPLIMAPLAAFMLASRYGTYNVPLLQKDPRSVWNLCKKFTKPIKGTILLIIGVHAIAGSFISYKEAMSVATVKHKLMLMEEALGPGSPN